MPIPTFISLVFACLSLLLAGGAVASSELHYEGGRVQAIMRAVLPQAQFDSFAVDTKDAPKINALKKSYPSKKDTLDFLAAQSAGSLHVPASKRPGRTSKAACYMLYAARDNESHLRIQKMSGLNNDKVLHIIVSHEASHCQVHALMDRSLENIRAGGSDLSWFPRGLHLKLKDAAVGRSSITTQEMSVAQFQRWTETLSDMFAVNALWLNGDLSEKDISQYLRFRTDDATRDPEHATAGGLRRLYAMIQALKNHGIAEKAYRDMSTDKQHQLLVGMLTEEARHW